MKNKLVFFIILFIFYFSSCKSVYSKDKYIIWINPVRGNDYWQIEDQSPIDFVIFQKGLAEDDDLPITWLIRPDFLFDSNYHDFFNHQKFKNDELGIFMEVTPTWAKEAGVDYREGEMWSDASSVFLSGYTRQQREKLIKTAYDKFNSIFNYYPKTIGAWHIDPYTAGFIVNNYDLESILICSDQYSTDGYQIWGGWWGVPYYPSRKNLLVPANNLSDKLGPVIFWWAQRDPVNGYGFNVKASTYSVQVNDYLLHDLDENYYSNLVDVYLKNSQGPYGQLTLGLENDMDLNVYISDFNKQLEVLKSKDAEFVQSGQFAEWYKHKFPNLSPEHQVISRDLLGTNKQVTWKMNTSSRIAVTGTDEVFDSRNYRNALPDPYFFNRNLTRKLYWNIQENQNIDINSSRKSLIWITLIIVGGLLSLRRLKLPYKLILVILTAGLLFSMPMIRSGLIYDFGMGFWGPNAHDGIWHISLIKQLNQNLPPLNPIFSGEVLTNYHWGFDLIGSLVDKIIPLSTENIYFQLLPLIFAIAIGTLSYILALKISKRQLTAVAFAMLNYFAGSFGWVVTLIKSGSIGGESLFWSMQSISTLINPPFAFSLIILFIGLVLWLEKRHESVFWQLFIGFLFGFLSLVKVYAGILIGFGLSFFWLYKLIKKENKRSDLIVLLSTALTSLIFLILMRVFNSQPGLVFRPLWFPHSLIESLDKVYLPKLAVLRINLLRQGLSIKLPILIIIELSLIVFFFIGNLGTRLFGLWQLILNQIKNKLTDFNLLAILIIVFGSLFPLLFIQKGTSWNTIQFFYYVQVMVNFYLAIYLTKLFDERKFFLLSLIILATIPTTYSTLRGYLGDTPPAAIPLYELSMLKKLEKADDGVVLTYPYEKYFDLDIQTPRPVYLYETTAYVSAMSGKASYLEDEMNLEITGYSWQKRLEDSKKFFTTYDKIWARGFLLNNKIDYIYLVNDQGFNLQPGDLGLKKIFSNGQVKIYQVKR